MFLTKPIHKAGRWLARFACAWWYSPLVALLAAADAFVLVVPIEALLVPAVLGRRSHWLRISVLTTVGSAVGAASFAWLAGVYGNEFVERFFPGITHEHAWRQALHLIHQHGGPGLALVSLSPFPQHAAVAVAGLAHMSVALVFASVLAGRLVKYCVLGWAVVHAPRVLRKLGIMKGKPAPAPERECDRKAG